MKVEKITLMPWFFLALPLTMYLIWVIFPVIQSLLFSLTSRDSIMYGEKKFIGFGNFIRLFQDPQFLLALKNNLIWLIFS